MTNFVEKNKKLPINQENKYYFKTNTKHKNTQLQIKLF